MVAKSQALSAKCKESLGDGILSMLSHYLVDIDTQVFIG